LILLVAKMAYYVEIFAALSLATTMIIIGKRVKLLACNEPLREI